MCHVVRRLNITFYPKPDYRINTKKNDKSTATEHFSVVYYLFSFITQPIHDTIGKKYDPLGTITARYFGPSTKLI